jgi:hypothetical protein
MTSKDAWASSIAAVIPAAPDPTMQMSQYNVFRGICLASRIIVLDTGFLRYAIFKIWDFKGPVSSKGKIRLNLRGVKHARPRSRIGDFSGPARGARFRGILTSRASEGQGGLSAQGLNRMGSGIGGGSGQLESIEGRAYQLVQSGVFGTPPRIVYAPSRRRWLNRSVHRP